MTHTEAIAAFIAANATEPRYQLLDIPGVELCEETRALCAACGQPGHSAQACPAVRAELMRPEPTKTDALFDGLSRSLDVCNEAWLQATAERDDLRAELQRTNDRLIKVRALLADGHEIVGSFMSPMVDTPEYWDSIMDGARTWLRKGVK